MVFSKETMAALTYGAAHAQVYEQMCVTRRASSNFEDNSRVGLVRHKEYTALK